MSATADAAEETVPETEEAAFEAVSEAAEAADEAEFDADEAAAAAEPDMEEAADEMAEEADEDLAMASVGGVCGLIGKRDCSTCVVQLSDIILGKGGGAGRM